MTTGKIHIQFSESVNSQYELLLFLKEVLYQDLIKTDIQNKHIEENKDHLVDLKVVKQP